MTSRTKIALRGTVVNIGQYATLVALQILITPLILKHLGQETLGAYSIVTQLVGYSLLMDLGFSVALGRFLAHAYGQPNRKTQFANIFRIGTLVFLVTNIAAATLILALAHWADSLIVATEDTVRDVQMSLYVYAIWLVLRSPLQIYGSGLFASQNLVAAHLIALGGSLVRYAGMIVAALAGAGLTSLIFATIGAELLVFLLQKRHFTQKVFPVESTLHDWLHIKIQLLGRMMRFGLDYFGVRLAQTMTTGTDALLIGYLFNAAQAAVFYTTKMPAFLLVQFIFKLSDNAAPAINEILGRGDLERVKTAYFRILKYTLMLAIPLAIGIISFNEFVVSLWVGSNQFAGQVMTVALGCYVITQAVAHVDAMIVVASGRMEYWTAVSVSIGLIYLAAAFFLGSHLGMEWIMVALALTDIVGVVFLHHRSSVVLGFSPIDILRASIFPAVKASVPVAIVALILSFVPSTSDLMYALSFFCLLLITWLLSSYSLALLPDEKHVIRHRITSLARSCGT